MSAASGADELADRPAYGTRGRTATVDRRSTGHVHALRSVPTDPRRAAGAVPGALAGQGPVRAEPVRAAEPPVLRAAAYPTVRALGVRRGAPGLLIVAFGTVAAVAYHHYDTLCRICGGAGAPSRAAVRAVGGHDGRTPAVIGTAAALAPPKTTVLAPAFAALAGAPALMVPTGSRYLRGTAGASAAPDGTGESQ